MLVNTIGAFSLGDALSTTPEALQRMIDVNLGPALWLSGRSRRTCSGRLRGHVHVAAPGARASAGMAVTA